MKKRMISMILTLAMVLALLPQVSFAAAPAGTPLEGDLGEDPYVISESGNYYLNSELVTGHIVIDAGAEVTLDLNGCVLQGKNVTAAAILCNSVIINRGSLTVKDSDKTKVHYFRAQKDPSRSVWSGDQCIEEACLWQLDLTASSGTSYEELTQVPDEDDIIAIHGGVITGGTGTRIDTVDPMRDAESGIYGGGILSEGESLVLDGVTVCGNTLYGPGAINYVGAGVFVRSGSCVMKNGSAICGNSYCGYSSHAGGISSISSLTIETGCSVSFNAAALSAGGIEVYQSSATITGCTIQGNASQYSGGIDFFGVDNDSNPSVLTLNACKIENNYAHYTGGGGLEMTNGTAYITGGTISNNTAQEYGGGLSCQGNVIMTDVTVSGNVSRKYHGGGIFAQGKLSQKTTLNLTNVTITNNETGWESAGVKIGGGNGGGIFIENNCSVSLNGCLIAENDTEQNGGGLYVKAGQNLPCDVTISGGAITENSAAYNGGGVYVDSFFPNYGTAAHGTVSMTNVVVSENSSAMSGGGAALGGSGLLLMNGCTVTGNTAAEYGGGIYKEESTIEIDGFDVSTVEKCVLLNTQVTDNIAGTHGGGVYFQGTTFNSCFVAGTLITMADGSRKKVEEIAEGEMVKTFDHERGTFSSAKVYLAWAEQTEPQPSFKLHFEGGYTLHCVASHCFLEKESRKYKTFNVGNAQDYVGHCFFGEDGQWHKLERVSIEEDVDWLYEIYTAEHQNAFAQGMLSVPADVDYMLNLYELDEDLKADAARLAADIEIYGLATYEYICGLGDMSQQWFHDAGSKYLNIAIGKGLVSFEEAYAEYMDCMDPSVDNGSMMLMSLSTGGAPALDDFDGGHLTIGDGTHIVDNIVGDTRENVYIQDLKGSCSLIKIHDTLTDAMVGVSLSLTPTISAFIPFTLNGCADDTAFFFSDKTPFADIYNTEEYLEMAVGSVVTEATCTNGAVSVGYAKSYYKDETVTVAAISDEGYAVEKIYYQPQGGEPVELTLSEGAGSFTMPDCDATVFATFKHVHQWSYAEGGAGNENTISATCTALGHTGDPEVLAITEPTLNSYGATGVSEKASLSGTTLGNLTVSDSSIKYYAKSGSGYAKPPISAPTKAGMYKAEITVNDGSKDMTAFVEYSIVPKQLQIAGTTVLDKGYDDTTSAAALMGTVDGVLAGDDATVIISSANFSDKSIGEGKEVTVCYSVTGKDASNYSAPQDDSCTANITIGSQKAPTAPATSGETIQGKADGKLTGVDSTMEYRKAGETTYTAISAGEVTGLAAGEYKVRYAAKTNYQASPDQTLVIATGSTMTVSFETYGGTAVDPFTDVCWQGTVRVPETEKTGYAFKEWNSDASGCGSKLTTATAILGSTTYHAIWVIDTSTAAAISGKVQQETATDPAIVTNALVELKQGKDVIAATWTDANGDYLFVGVAAGEYNIVVTGCAYGTENKTKTTLIVLESENLTGVNVLLPRGNVSSLVEVKANTPKVLVGGLDDEAAAQAGSNLSDTIRFVLTVESVADVTGDPDAPASEVAAQSAIKQAASGKTVEFIEMDITKYVNTVDSAVHEVGNVLEIIVPYATAGKKDISVYRFHDGDCDGVLDAGQQISMTRLDARPVAPYTDNTYFVGDGYIVIYTRYFSAYAIGYSTNTGRSFGRKTADGADGADSASVAELLEKARLCPQDETCVYAPFIDADPQAWYHAGVHFCVEMGYMKGVGGNRFAPSGTLSRAMVVTMLWNMEGQPAVDYAMSFADVAEDQWYTESVRWAQSTGVVKGYSDERFGPADAVTREQLATILMQYAAFKGMDVSARADLAKFTDAGTVSGWAVDYVRWANAEDIINGRSETTLAPADKTTRAEAACMLKNFCEKM